MAGSQCSRLMMSIMVEPVTYWPNANGSLKPPGSTTLNASFEGSRNPDPFPKRSGSTHPRQRQPETLLSKS